MHRLLILVAVLVGGCGGGAIATERPATPTEAPTEAPIVEYANLGVISFGKSFDEDTLEIVDERTKFKRTVNEIAWSAILARTVGATSMEIVIASVSKAGSERVIIKEEVAVSNPDSALWANAADLATLVENKPGTYVMRYIESGEVLAEGTFTLVK